MSATSRRSANLSSAIASYPPETPKLLAAVSDGRMTLKQLRSSSNAGALNRVNASTKAGALHAFLLTMASRGAKKPTKQLTVAAQTAAAVDSEAIDREYARFRAWAAAAHSDYVSSEMDFANLTLDDIAPTVAAALSEMEPDQLEHDANAGTPDKAKSIEERWLLTVARRSRTNSCGFDLIRSQYTRAPARAVLETADPKTVVRETAMLEQWLECRHPQYINGDESHVKRKLEFDSSPAVQEVHEVHEPPVVRDSMGMPQSLPTQAPVAGAGAAAPVAAQATVNRELLSALIAFYSQPGRKQKSGKEIALLAAKYTGREEELYTKLEKQYPGCTARPGKLAAAGSSLKPDLDSIPGPIEAAVAAAEGKASEEEWNAEMSHKKAIEAAERAAAMVKKTEEELTKARERTAKIKKASMAAALALKQQRTAEAMKRMGRRSACVKWFEAAIAVTVLCVSIVVSTGLGMSEMNALIGSDEL